MKKRRRRKRPLFSALLRILPPIPSREDVLQFLSRSRNNLLHLFSRVFSRDTLLHLLPRRAYAAPDRRRHRRPLPLWVRQLIALSAVVIFAFSLFNVLSILGRMLHTRQLNAELARVRSMQVDETPAPTEVPSAQTIVMFTPEPTPEAAPLPAESTQPPMDASALAASLPTPTPEATPVSFHRFGGSPLPNMETLYNQNHDLIAWLEIPEIISLPVVYKDNSYYLTHDFNKKKSAAGTLFLDEHHRFSEQAQNLLLHGHNMKDGTMFGRLVHYIQSLDYYRSNAFVHFDTLWEKEEYVIFAVLRVPLDVSSPDFVNYFSHPTFASDRAFESYVRQLQLGSVYAIPIDVKPSDALLTLSTCLDDDRLVIVCRRIRSGESRSHLRELVRSSTRQ